MVGKSVLILGIKSAEVLRRLKSDIMHLDVWKYQAPSIIEFVEIVFHGCAPSCPPWPNNTSSSTRFVRLSILGREHKHVLPRTGPELNHILVSQLEVPTIRYLVAIEFGTVCTLQVNQIRLHAAHLIPVLVSLLRIAELDDGMLLADARVLGRQVGNGQVPPN